MARTTQRELKFHLEPLVELVGLEEVIRQLGVERVVKHLGPEQVLQHVELNKVVAENGLDWWLAKLTPAQRRELKRRLQLSTNRRSR